MELKKVTLSRPCFTGCNTLNFFIYFTLKISFPFEENDSNLRIFLLTNIALKFKNMNHYNLSVI